MILYILKKDNKLLNSLFLGQTINSVNQKLFNFMESVINELILTIYYYDVFDFYKNPFFKNFWGNNLQNKFISFINLIDLTRGINGLKHHFTFLDENFKP